MTDADEEAVSGARAALAKAYWFSKFFDEIERNRIERAGGMLDRGNVERIARWYSVTRTLPKDKTGVAAIVNQIASKMAGRTLLDRARLCEDAAARIDNEKHPRSTVSKLLWFVAPTDWTVYDSFAAKGAKARSSPIGRDPFLDYYSRLERAEFGTVVAEIQRLLREAGITDLQAERIVDWELMRRGRAPEFTDIHDWLPAYLSTLSAEVIGRVNDAARLITTVLEDFQPDRVR